MNTEDNGETLARQPIGRIAATLPGATSVFRKFELDFCCGGNVTLSEAARGRGIDIAEIERDLAALEPSTNETKAPEDIPGLIDHILTRYHETHRRELPELVELARKIEIVHAGHPMAPRGIADLLQVMAGELEVHMKKEELILFPAMRRGAPGLPAALITQMRADHDDHGAHLRTIDELTGKLELPGDACRSWQALYGGIAKLVEDLTEHIHLENNILFPQFEGHRAD